VLDRLAAASGELARLGVVEGDHITFVGKAQGAKSGLRYDPDMGSQPPLHCTASGQAWLASMSDEEALELVSKQGGLGKAGQSGPKAPKTIQQFLQDIEGARRRGYGIAIETYEPGMTSMAAPIHHPVTGVVVGVVSLAGPTSRLPESRLAGLAPALLEAASDMAAATLSSPYFKAKPAAAAPVASLPAAKKQRQKVS
jgi:DNA-binding IclR family transcriptional regulator